MWTQYIMRNPIIFAREIQFFGKKNPILWQKNPIVLKDQSQ